MTAPVHSVNLFITSCLIVVAIIVISVLLEHQTNDKH